VHWPRRIRVGRHPKRKDDVGDVQRVFARNHADDGERLAIEPERLPDGVRPAGEAALPEAVRQHRHALRLPAERCVGFGKHPSDYRLKPEHRWCIASVVLGPH
jgi:hypothetical protein